MYKMKVSDIRDHFMNELKEERFITDKSGQKTIEMIGASFIADEPAIFGTPNEEYIDDEIEWYLSGSTNINDIYKGEREPPAAWKLAANSHGEINSNYGYLIFDDRFFRQYDNVINELTINPDSRRGCMVYNRPSVWVDHCDGGKNDFICTNAVTYYIRDDALHSVVQMRSNDVVFGYKNDYAWQNYLIHVMSNQLELEMGTITWQVQNLHVYERHFHLVK